MWLSFVIFCDRRRKSNTGNGNDPTIQNPTFVSNLTPDVSPESDSDNDYDDVTSNERQARSNTDPEDNAQQNDTVVYENQAVADQLYVNMAHRDRSSGVYTRLNREDGLHSGVYTRLNLEDGLHSGNDTGEYDTGEYVNMI